MCSVYPTLPYFAMCTGQAVSTTTSISMREITSHRNTHTHNHNNNNDNKNNNNNNIGQTGNMHYHASISATVKSVQFHLSTSLSLSATKYMTSTSSLQNYVNFECDMQAGKKHDTLLHNKYVYIMNTYYPRSIFLALAIATPQRSRATYIYSR